MLVLGIDPGTAIVGYGLIEYKKNKMKIITYGCIYTEKELPLNKRLEIIYNELIEIIEKYKPDTFAIEELFYFKNNKTVISVSQARGIMLLAATQKNLPIFEYTPLQVKIGITGYGRAEKKQVQLMVQRILNLEEIPKPDDAADALAIAITHINSTGSVMSIVSSRSVKKDKINIKSGKMTAKEFRELYK